MAKAKRIAALDGLRGLAVLTIVIYHIGGGAQASNPILRTFGTVIQAGWSGVTLFFVLSGFLITGALWDSRGSPHWYRNFFLRRTLRITPLYYLALLFVLISGFFVEHTFRVATHLWVFLLYLQNIPGFRGIGDSTHAALTLSHFWSLAVEEQFYLLWPFLVTQVANIRQMKSLCVAVFLASFLFRIVTALWLGDSGYFNNFILSRAGELAFGAWIAMSWREESWGIVESWLTRLSPLFLLGFLVSSIPGWSFKLDFVWVSTFGLVFITLFWGTILAAALRPGPIARILEMKALCWVGSISYGLYVYHVLFSKLYHNLAQFLVPSGNRNLMLCVNAVITVTVSIGLAYLSFRFFERPILESWKPRPRVVIPLAIPEPAC